MDNASVEKYCSPEGDVTSQTGLETVQCTSGLNSSAKRRRKRKKNKKNRGSFQNSGDKNDNFPKGTLVETCSEKLDSSQHPGVDTCLSTDLEMMPYDAEVTLSQKMDNEKKQNKSHNAAASNDINQDFHEGDCPPSVCLTDSGVVERANAHSVPKVADQLTKPKECLEASATKRHAGTAQVDVYSSKQSSIRTYKRKRKTYRRKKKKLLNSAVSHKECTADASSMTNTSLNHSNEAVHSTSLLVVEDIIVEKASDGCPDGEPASGEQEKMIRMENIEKLIGKLNVMKDASSVDVPEKTLELGSRDTELAVNSAEENLHKPTIIYRDEKPSDDVSGSDPSVQNRESDNLDMLPQLQEAIPSSQFNVITDDASIDVIGKEGAKGACPGKLRKKLLVLDVNGLLADIVPYVSDGYTPDTIISRKALFKRPFCDDFLLFCFERFNVGVWSSRTKRNVESALDFLMGKSKHNLLFCWDQSHCTNTGYNTVENRDKPLVLKELKKLWEKHEPDLPWERGEYNESNTLLLDDSPYKALRNPPHTAIFPKSYQYKDAQDNSLGPGGDLRVYLEGLALADNVQEYVKMNPFGQRAISKTNLSWPFYAKIVNISSPPERCK